MITLLKKLEQRFSNKFVGADIFLNNDQLSISYVVIKKTGDTIHIEESGENLNSFDELKQKNLHKLPMLISINGRGIIHKKHISDSHDSTEIKILSHAIPGFDASMLYYQIVPTDNPHENYISVIRKELLDTVIDNLKVLGFYYTEVLLGPYSISNLGNHFKDVRVVTNNYSFTFGNTLIFDAEKSENVSTHQIGEDQISGNLVSAFGMATGYFLNKSPIAGNIDELVKNRKEEFMYFFLLRRFTVLALLFIFCLLLINYLVFSHYSSKQSETGTLLRGNKESVAKIKVISEEISKKESYLNENNLLYTTRISFYADRIASYVPKEMSLTELLIFPPKNDLKDKSEILYHQNKIIIRGKTNPIELNSFISNLSGETWIEDTDITDYKTITGTELVNFTVELIIKRK